MTSHRDILTDLFGRTHRYLRISVTDRCNLRCRYCMPRDGIRLRPRADLLTLEEIYRIARLFVSLGTNKVRITGGEPLVRRGLLSLLDRLGELPGIKRLGITTNGTRVYPIVHDLVAAGVTHINFSLDTLDRDRYFRITTRDDLPLVMRAIRASLVAGFHQVKLNCVVMKGVNDDELAGFVAFGRDYPVSIRFIEYMPFAGNGWDAARLMSYHEMLERLGREYPLEPVATGDSSQTARLYRIDGHAGTIGFITPMTQHFCSGCNRMRLTSDGHLKNCLFGQDEVNLRDPIRNGISDEGIAALIRSSILAKQAASGHASPPSQGCLETGRELRGMFEVGG